MQKCMHTLLLAGANAQLININGRTAPQWADVQGKPTTVVERVRQHHTAYRRLAHCRLARSTGRR